jgi:hypothetical protein
MKRPALGQQIKASDRLIRFLGPDGQKEWDRASRHLRCSPKPVNGIYIGRRTYANGIAEWNGDWIATWKPNKHIEIWLIVPGEHNKPVPVLPEDCEF